jgi:hypothetical protein
MDDMVLFDGAGCYWRRRGLHSRSVELVGMNPLPEKYRRYWARLMWYSIPHPYIYDMSASDIRRSKAFRFCYRRVSI